jgi:hypothetical protein
LGAEQPAAAGLDGVIVQACRGADREMATSSAGIEMIVKAAAAMAAEPASSPVEKPVEKPEANLAARGVRAAWWSTGEFAIEDSDGRVTIFPPDVAAPILAFAARLGRVAA